VTFADHYSAFAARYAAYRPTYPPALVDALADRAPATALAWDVGCGNGQLSVALAGRFARVIATDPSAAQLAAATVHPRVEYRREPAEASSLAAASADLIVAAQAAHWFDWPRFVAEAARVGRPGALIALVSYGAPSLEPDDAARALARYRAAVQRHWPPGREHVDNGYRDLVLPWPAVDAPPFAMQAAWTRDQLVGYVSTWSATARCTEAEGPAAFDRLRAELAEVWPGDELRTIRWPLAVRLARLP
jgi:SAM-dependent methyltransferase